MKLADYLEATNTSVGAFAKTIGVNEKMSVRRYLSGERIPSREVMPRIVAATKGAVQPNDFYPAAQAA